MERRKVNPTTNSCCAAHLLLQAMWAGLFISFVFSALEGYCLMTGDARFSPKSASGKPNVIVIITDDQGYGDMSCHGNPWLSTPNIDQLHAESTRLTDFHVSPTCAPTRAALLTGHYSNRTGVWHTIAGRSLLRESEMTMADVFQYNGYATGIFGKWHLGDNFPFRPQDRGFKEVLIHGGGGVGQGPDYWDNDYFDDFYLHNGKPEKFAGYCTDVWFDNAIRFIDSKSEEGKPFFCYLSTNAPHSPFYVEDRYVDEFRDNENVPVPAFYGMISNLDDNIGKLLRYLRRNSLEENTLVIFMTDNGTSSGVRFRDGILEKGFNAGMRGQKASMYEGGHRVPCFIRWPGGGIVPGRDVNDLTAHVDLLPTMIDLLRLKLPTTTKFDGVSLKQILLNQAQLPVRTLITDSQRIERPEPWRRSSVMRGTWRLINGRELYDVRVDPGQQVDIAGKHPEVVRQLRRDYETWWDDIAHVFDEAPAIALCSEEEPTTIIRTHDMHMDELAPVVPWNHEQIRNGMRSTGWYSVSTSKRGTYKFTLMRWPPEANVSFTESAAPLPAIESTTVPARASGKGLSIRKGGISIGEVSLQDEPNCDDGVSFEVSIPAGHHKLRAWFVDDKNETFAAYYIKVEKI